MSMSRKDFELIARTIKSLRETDIEDDSVVDVVAERLATALVGHSSTFDKDRFLKACGVKQKETS